MTRTSVNKVRMRGPWGSYSAGAVDLPMQAADVANGNLIVLSGYDLVVVHNSGASVRTITIDSVPDPITLRPGPITDYSLGAGEYAVFGPFGMRGWASEDGDRSLHVDASHAEVLIGAVSWSQVETAELPLMAFEDGSLIAWESGSLAAWG